MGLGKSLVSGLTRVPCPAASIIPLIFFISISANIFGTLMLGIQSKQGAATRSRAHPKLNSCQLILIVTPVKSINHYVRLACTFQFIKDDQSNILTFLRSGG